MAQIYVNKKEAVFSTIENKEIWIKVENIIRYLNNSWLEFDEIDDENKDKLKRLFQLIGEELPEDIDFIESINEYMLSVNCFKSGLSMFVLDYNKVNYVKYYNWW